MVSGGVTIEPADNAKPRARQWLGDDTTQYDRKRYDTTRHDTIPIQYDTKTIRYNQCVRFSTTKNILKGAYYAHNLNFVPDAKTQTILIMETKTKREGKHTLRGSFEIKVKLCLQN